MKVLRFFHENNTLSRHRAGGLTPGGLTLHRIGGLTPGELMR